MFENICVLIFQVFIEFSSEEDADRFGVWCCLQKEALGHEVHRLKEPSEARSEREEVTGTCRNTVDFGPSGFNFLNNQYLTLTRSRFTMNPKPFLFETCMCDPVESQREVT